MNKILLIISLMWIGIGCNQYGKKTKTHNINTTNNVIWDLEALIDPPEYEFIGKEEKVRKVLYKGPLYMNNETKVFAYYSNPEILKTGNNNSKRTYPGIVLIHGGGGKAFRPWVEKWAAEGYAALAMDLSGNDGEGQRLPNGGPQQSYENKFQSIKDGVETTWTFYHIQSIILGHSLLLSFPEVDKNRTVVTGISWGGYLTCIVASVDNRFKAACPVYGCGYFNELTGPADHFMNLDTELQERWMKFLDPKNYLVYAEQPFFFINGNKDGFFDILPYHKTYNLIPDSNRIIRITPDMKHSHRNGWHPFEIKIFFDNVLFDDFGLPKITHVKSNGDFIFAEYTSPVSLRQAEFYFSKDTSNNNRERIWVNKIAKITEKMIKIRVPQDNFQLGFFYIMDHRGLSTSSELIMNISLRDRD